MHILLLGSQQVLTGREGRKEEKKEGWRKGGRKRGGGYSKYIE